MNRIEDCLTEDLVAYWNASRPSGLPAEWNIYHAHREGARETPYVVIGEQGFARVPGQPDTGRVELRVMPVSVIDSVTPEVHRDVAGIIDDAVQALLLADDPLDRTFIHDILRQQPAPGMDKDKRHEFTELRYTAVVSRTRATV